MPLERQSVENLFKELCDQVSQQFPQPKKELNAPLKPGVYVIRKGKDVLHVGRTLRAKYGIWQRLYNHLHGQSSFTWEYLKGKVDILREGCTYQYLIVKDERLRALLEAYAIGRLCPKHLGLGKKRRERS